MKNFPRIFRGRVTRRSFADRPYTKSQKQPNQVLPAPGRASVSRGPAVARGMVAPLRSSRGNIDGAPGVQLEFTARQAVYIDTVRVSGAAGNVAIQARSGVPAGTRRVITLKRTDGSKSRCRAGATKRRSTAPSTGRRGVRRLRGR